MHTRTEGQRLDEPFAGVDLVTLTNNVNSDVTYRHCRAPIWVRKMKPFPVDFNQKG